MGLTFCLYFYKDDPSDYFVRSSIGDHLEQARKQIMDWHRFFQGHGGGYDRPRSRQPKGFVKGRSVPLHLGLAWGGPLSGPEVGLTSQQLSMVAWGENVALMDAFQR